MTAQRTNGYEFAKAKERLWEGDPQTGNIRCVIIHETEETGNSVSSEQQHSS
jgi:CRISPR/Cas system-associated protein endoribonuclease Cas2